MSCERPASPSALTDRSLVPRFRRGEDDDAATELYQRYALRLLAFTKSRLPTNWQVDLPKPLRCWISVSSVLPILILSLSIAKAENWPAWRGPRGDGSSVEVDVPVRWNGTTGENVRWKTALPGEGHSSPIVWQDKLFLTVCIPDSQERALLCIDRETGTLVWQQSVLTATLESKHALNSFASGTPATDGEFVYVTFLEPDGRLVTAPNIGSARDITAGKMVVAAYDLNGQQRWIVRPGEFISAHGYCSCPVLFKDTVIVNGDHDGDSYVVALKKATGEVLWKVPRKHRTRSYVTPLVRTIDGQDQLVFSGSKSIVSLDPNDGSTIWEFDGPTEQFVASMVYDGELFFVSSGFPDYHVLGIRPTGRGNVTDSHVAWHATNARCYVPSPVVIDGFLLIADDRGTGNCYDAKTGERLWKERLGNGYHASLVHANGNAYWTATNGTTKVIKPGEQLNVIAENALGENLDSSLAISNGALFLRGEKHLFCIAHAK